jgi:NIPSNAP
MTAEPPKPIGGVIELRQYTLRPGTRDAFVALFDTELAEPQEAAGMRVLGQFRDLDRPDMFVWLRDFPDMEVRRRALQGFYDGPVWAAHRDAANGMMLDSDDVLLLEPAGASPFLDAGAGARPPGAAPAGGVVTVRVDPVALADTARFARRYAFVVAPALHAAGGRPLALLASLHTVNNFPRLPVREHENVMVSLTRFASLAAAGRAAADQACRDALASLDDLCTGPGQRLRLAATPRSALR